MRQSTTITINGRLYDAVTGMPVAQAAAQKIVAPANANSPSHTFNDIGPGPQVSMPKPVPPAPHALPPSAQTVHAHSQKSQTLYRQALKRPQTEVPVADSGTRSPLINRFSPAAAAASASPATPQPESRVTPMHPIVMKALQKTAPIAEEKLTGSALKEQLIKERLAEVGDEQKPRRQSFWARQPRMATILTSTLSLLILGGYITYINLPNISMKVAAARAGVNATLPNYRPDGYSLSGAITYSPGQVNIGYKSNTGDGAFKLSEQASSWDSQAVLDNYVTKQTGNYLTFQDNGLTIFTFGNKAAWANGGLMYTLDGASNLSSEQILHLATSL